MFFLYFLCLCFMYYSCEKYYKPITVQYHITYCISWVPKLTLLDLWTCSWNRTLFVCRGLTVLKYSCWNQLETASLRGSKFIIIWTVNRHVAKAEQKTISNLQIPQIILQQITKPKMWWQGKEKQRKYYIHFAKQILNCVFCWLFFLDFYSHVI